VMTDYYKNNKILMTAIAILFLFLIWELIAQLLKNPALPCPIPALTTFIQIFPLGLWKHFMISTYRVLTSILVGLALAVPLGLYIGRNTNIDKWLSPQLYLIYPIPNPLKFRFCLLFCLSCQITEFSINLIFFLKVTNYIWHFTHPLFKIFWPYDHQFFPCQAPAFHQPHSLPADRSFNQIANQTSISFIIIAFSFFFL
jgi:ABC-type nitrate/sulfonate/bicarbonate transport system permease component